MVKRSNPCDRRALQNPRIRAVYNSRITRVKRARRACKTRAECYTVLKLKATLKRKYAKTQSIKKFR